MLFLDSELHPFSPITKLEAWRDRLLEMKGQYPEPEDRLAIDRELARIGEYLQNRKDLDSLLRAKSAARNAE